MKEKLAESGNADNQDSTEKDEKDEEKPQINGTIVKETNGHTAGD